MNFNSIISVITLTLNDFNCMIESKDYQAKIIKEEPLCAVYKRHILNIKKQK